MHNKADSKNLIKNLLAVAPKHCDNCGSKYAEDDFRIVRSSAVNTVLHLKCHVCGNAYMLNVMNPLNGMVGSQRTPINIDLRGSEEIQLFAGKDPVTQNEAIDTYNEIDAEFDQKAIRDLLL
ncbi:MAG: hypothetical protein QY330_04780 [Candidatus Dojkabacteria bacterium]|uniref:Uncharacterized protein n=1 Tax=Candidatus Dojkabacteria bacterium TaxID=2099670 RepID=A0A952AHW8_9BACT|nr:hypothetical protein [Candidatus Dojkabacteria bacterium]WKZ27831.1 MAG: hypothetical protein QY330_04780 [Candidatus Dojkabacteria bacterium]